MVITRSDAATISFEYDDAQRPIRIIDPNGGKWRQR
jgi:YD repeat-containing protein